MPIEISRAEKTNVGAAARSKVTNKPATPIIAPITEENKLVGAVGAVFLTGDISFPNDIIANLKIGETGCAFVIDKTGLTIAHSRVKNVFAVDVSLARCPGMEEVAPTCIRAYQKRPVSRP